MTRRKREKITQLPSLDNVFLQTKEMRGKWNSDYFRRNCPITLELGCGWGEYSLAMSRLFPDRNFIAVDLRGSRFWKGATIALDQGITNIAFLRARIEQITDYIAPGEAAEIWLPFSDPHPKRRHAKNRLTAPRFLELYRTILIPGSRIHLKTDSNSLFQYTLEVLQSLACPIHSLTTDLYRQEEIEPLLAIQTKYERDHLRNGRTIKYVCFSLSASNGRTNCR